MIKRFFGATILCLFLLFVFSASRGQTLPFYLRTLTERGIEISFDGAAARSTSAVQPLSQVSGYRLCLFSDNGQTARGAAGAALGMLSSVAPEVPAQMVYTNPFFRVYAGYCLNKAEATMLLGRLRGVFPKAYIVAYQGDVRDFLVTSPAASPGNTIIDSTAIF